jgi:hypothetical protein
LSSLKAELSQATIELQRLARQLPAFYGWSIEPRPSKDRVKIELRDPVFGEVTGLGLSLQEFKTRRKLLLLALAKSPEVALINSAPKDPSNPKLLTATRSAASGYGWSFETFRQVIELLTEADAIREDEFLWLLDSGPWSHPNWVGYPHARPAWRGLPDGSAKDQYKAYRRRYLADKRRFERRRAPKNRPAN